MPSFSVNVAATNTQSTTIPMVNGMSTATNQAAIYEINSGGDTSSDNAGRYAIMRTTTRGTNSSSVTPNAVDQNVTQAALSTWDTAWNAGPAITASSWILWWGQHQRATYRWVAYDYTKMLRCQAGAATKGMALMAVSISSPWAANWSIEYDE